MANYAKIMKMPERKLKNEAIMHNPVISSLKTNRKDKNNEATFIFSAPLDALLMIDTVDTKVMTNNLANEGKRFVKNILNGEDTTNAIIITDSLGIDRNITKKRKHGDTEIHKPSKERNIIKDARNREVNCSSSILNNTLKANDGNMDGCWTDNFQSTPGSIFSCTNCETTKFEDVSKVKSCKGHRLFENSCKKCCRAKENYQIDDNRDITFVKPCNYCWIFQSTKQCDYCKKYNAEIFHNETICKELLNDSNKGSKDVKQTSAGFLESSLTDVALNNEAINCGNSISFKSQSENAEHQDLNIFNLETHQSLSFVEDEVENTTEFKKTDEQFNSQDKIIETNMTEMKNVGKVFVTYLDVNLNEDKIDLSTYNCATENTTDGFFTDLQSTENSFTALETKNTGENNSVTAVEKIDENAMIINEIKSSDVEVTNTDEKDSTSNTDDVEVNSNDEKDSTTKNVVPEQMDVDETVELMQLKLDNTATSPPKSSWSSNSTLRMPHVPIHPPFLQPSMMMDFISIMNPTNDLLHNSTLQFNIGDCQRGSAGNRRPLRKKRRL